MARDRRGQRGFVLAVTMWLLAGMAVAVALMTLWARAEVEAATRGRDAFEDDAAALTLRVGMSPMYQDWQLLPIQRAAFSK